MPPIRRSTRRSKTPSGLLDGLPVGSTSTSLPTLAPEMGAFFWPFEIAQKPLRRPGVRAAAQPGAGGRDAATLLGQPRQAQAFVQLCKLPIGYVEANIRNIRERQAGLFPRNFQDQFTALLDVSGEAASGTPDKQLPDIGGATARGIALVCVGGLLVSPGKECRPPINVEIWTSRILRVETKR